MRTSLERTFLVMVAAALIGACSDDSNLTVTTKQDNTADFSKYKTFAIVDGSQTPAAIQSLIPRIRPAPSITSTCCRPSSSSTRD